MYIFYTRQIKNVRVDAEKALSGKCRIFTSLVFFFFLLFFLNRVIRESDTRNHAWKSKLCKHVGNSIVNVRENTRQHRLIFQHVNRVRENNRRYVRAKIFHYIVISSYFISLRFQQEYYICTHNITYNKYSCDI